MIQLINSVPSKSNNFSGTLKTVLQDIIDRVEIRGDFSVRHPDYKPLELPEEASARFQQMPEQMQRKFLSLQLRSFLYGIYYSGAMREALALDTDVEDNELALDLENNTVLGVDLEFYHRIHSSNAGEGYFEPGWLVIDREDDHLLVVTKGGLKLHVERDRHLQSTEQDAVVGDKVSIKMPKNRVQNGFYMSISNTRVDSAANQSVLIRIYFNLTPDGAVAVMSSLTQHLNALNISFDFKVLYNPQDYNRHDSAVLYFTKDNYEQVHQILQGIYLENQSHFKPEVPLFTLELAPGLALAEEPDQKFAAKESFGMNRCQIIANGLLEAWYQNKNSPEEKMQCILSQFVSLGIDINRTYLNADAEDIYTTLSC